MAADSTRYAGVWALERASADSLDARARPPSAIQPISRVTSAPDSDDVEEMRVLLGTVRALRRWIAPRAVGVAVVAVLALAVASWVVGDLARNYAIGRLHAENDLIALQGDQTETHRLAAEATAARRIAAPHRAEFVASERQTEFDLTRLVQHPTHPSLVRSIQRADTRFD